MYEKSHKIKRPRITEIPATQQQSTTQQQSKIWLPIPPCVLKRLSFFIESRKIPHILFHGNSGTGKRTIVNQFIREIYGNNQKMIENNVMYVNCAHEKGIQFIRDEIKTFARVNVQPYPCPSVAPVSEHMSVAATGPSPQNMFKIIILQNADKLTADAQSALRRSIEIYSHNTRFFIIVENIQKIMNPILSRFCELYIPDRMDTDGNVVSLHKLGQFFDQVAKKGGVSSECKREIKELLACKSTTPQKWMDLCSGFYERGISAYDVVDALTEMDITQPPMRSKLEMEFQKVKSEFRCEKLLMFYLFMFLLEQYDEHLLPDLYR